MSPRAPLQPLAQPRDGLGHELLALLRAESAGRPDALLDRIRALEGVQQTTTSVVLWRCIDRA